LAVRGDLIYFASTCFIDKPHLVCHD